MRSARSPCSLSVEFSLVRENILLQNERIAQLYVIQSEQDPYIWFGVLFVDNGIYMGAVVRFNMIIDESYPNCPCPRIIFDPIPYHPLVDPETGELDTKNAFSDWSGDTHKLHQLLLFTKRVICQAETYINQIQDLINQDLIRTSTIDLDSTRSQTVVIKHDEISQEAQMIGGSVGGDEIFSQSTISLFANFKNTLRIMRTYEKNPDEFGRRVEEFKQNCCHKLFDNPESSGGDKNALLFTPWNPNLHEPLRDCILAGRFAPTSLFASYHKETDSVLFVPGSEPP